MKELGLETGTSRGWRLHSIAQKVSAMQTAGLLGPAPMLALTTVPNIP